MAESTPDPVDHGEIHPNSYEFANGRIVLSKAQAAREFGLNPRTIAKRLTGEQPALRSGKRGSEFFSIRQIAEAILTPEKMEVDEVEQRRAELKLREDALKLARLEREEMELHSGLVPIDQNDAFLADVFKQLREGAESIPDLIERRCRPGADVLGALDDVIVQVLTVLESRLSEYGCE